METLVLDELSIRIIAYALKRLHENVNANEQYKEKVIDTRESIIIQTSLNIDWSN